MGGDRASMWLCLALRGMTGFTGDVMYEFGLSTFGVAGTLISCLTGCCGR